MSNLSEVRQYIKESLINMSLQLCVSYMNKHSHFINNFTSFITTSQHLELKVKIQNDPNEKITTFTESSVP